MNTNERINYLWQQYSTQKANRQELDELFNLLTAESQEEYSRAYLEQLVAGTPAGPLDLEHWEPILQRILHPAQSRVVHLYSEKPARKFPAWWWAAAAILIVVVIGNYHWAHRSQPNITRTTPEQTDIQPGGNRATLTLANGAKILLDTAHNGDLAQQGNTKILKQNNGLLTYLPSSPRPREMTGRSEVNERSSGQERPGEIGAGAIAFNILTTPRGGEFGLTLPDGSKVWLNAASSITFPTSFTGNNRSVSISGEAYFEISKDPVHPFIVNLSNHWMQVEVLGTHFNINDYNDEDDHLARTTLLEGSVKVTAHGQSNTIRPGQQAATAFESKDITLNNNVDLDKVMAWKNGEMVLSNGNLPKLMREISRWYDVDIKFEGAIPDKKFFGSVSRNVPLSSALRALKAYGIETKLEGKVIIVQ